MFACDSTRGATCERVAHLMASHVTLQLWLDLASAPQSAGARLQALPRRVAGYLIAVMQRP
eukprot:1126445-Pyramimonas_sp.AAC.1